MITMKDIVLEGHPALRKRAEKLTFPLTQEQQELAKEMLEFLHNSQDQKSQKNMNCALVLVLQHLNLANPSK